MTTAATRQARALLLVFVLAALALTLAKAPPASAAGCASQTATKAFSRFGDFNDYFLLPSGHFESGAGGWTLSTGAKVVPGNETYYLRSSADKASLQIPASGTVKSPWVCIAKNEPMLRFVARSSGSGTGGNYTNLVASMTIKGSTGSVVNVYLGDLSAASYAGWKPSPIYSYAVWLNQAWLYNGGDTVQVQVQFAVGGSGGSWNIDDLYIDPFKLV
jgi:hypothetical protein